MSLAPWIFRHLHGSGMRLAAFNNTSTSENDTDKPARYSETVEAMLAEIKSMGRGAGQESVDSLRERLRHLGISVYPVQQHKPCWGSPFVQHWRHGRQNRETSGI